MKVEVVGISEPKKSVWAMMKKFGKPARITMVTILVIFFLVGLLEVVDRSPIRWIRNVINADSRLDSVKVDVIEDRITEVFKLSTLEIQSSNMALIDIVPGGFINPGTLTFILEYDSIVRFGIREPQRIHMRKVGNVIFVEQSSVQIEILDSSVKNFIRTKTFKSNPIVRFTPAVIDQMFQAQKEFESVAAERLDNDQNRESAKRSFYSIFEAICGSLDLVVIWE